MEQLMGPEQRSLFRETQAVMSLLEGFSDYVMDEVGRGLVPDVERISARFHERRNRRTPFERAMLRLTGLDLKMEQYRKGEQFVAAIAAARGPGALGRLWDGPETLPRDGEIDGPGALDRARPRRSGRVSGTTEKSAGQPAPDAGPGPGPGSGPGGAPSAIALSPILSARYRSRDLERIRAAAPGARLVMVSVEGLADGPLDDVEVLLRGWLSSDAFDRLLARAPRLAWVHSATSGVERRPHAGVARARPRRDQRPRRVQPADRRVRDDDDPGRQPAAAAAPRAAARADVAAARGRASCAT